MTRRSQKAAVQNFWASDSAGAVYNLQGEVDQLLEVWSGCSPPWCPSGRHDVCTTSKRRLALSTSLSHTYESVLLTALLLHSCLSSTLRMASHGRFQKITGDIPAYKTYLKFSSILLLTSCVSYRAYHLFTDFQLQRLALRGVSCWRGVTLAAFSSHILTSVFNS